MKNNLEKLFTQIGESGSLDFLADKIMVRIERRKMIQSRVRFFVADALAGLSFLSLFPIAINTFKQLQTSGFLSYFSLLFTDGGTMLTYWREFLLSLAESLPLLQLTLIGLSLLVLFISLRFASKNYRQNIIHHEYQF